MARWKWAGSLGVSAFRRFRFCTRGGTVREAVRMSFCVSGKTTPFGGRAGDSLLNFAEMAEKWVRHDRNNRYGSDDRVMDTVPGRFRLWGALRDGTDEGEERFANLQGCAVWLLYMPGARAMPEEQTPLALFLEEVSLVSDVKDFGAGERR